MTSALLHALQLVHPSICLKGRKMALRLVYKTWEKNLNEALHVVRIINVCVSRFIPEILCMGYQSKGFVETYHSIDNKSRLIQIVSVK